MGEMTKFILLTPVDSKFTNIPFNMDEIVEKLKEFAVNVQSIDDPFFNEGNTICGVYSRKGIIDKDEEDLCHEQYDLFKCEVPNCTQEFDTLLKYELHYNSCHRYSCSFCKKQLPSPHLLDLHISESHDSFFKTASERKPMFKCFVETCNVLSNNSQERRSHCIEVHRFPHDFRYDKRNNVQKQKNKKKKNRKVKVEEVEMMESDNAIEDTKVGEQARVVVNVPAFSGPFTFGHKKNCKSFNTRMVKTNNTKPINMTELMESLPADDTSTTTT